MKLIKISTQQYPYPLESLQSDYPHTWFPAELEIDYPNVPFPDTLIGTDLSEFDVAIVRYAEKPLYDTHTQYIVDTTPQLVEGQWIAGWEILDKPPASNWAGFNLTLFTDAAFVAYGVTATGVNPYLVPAIVERYGRVSTEGIIGSGFATYWDIFCTSLMVTAAHRESWAVIAEANNLPLDFVQLIRGV